MGKDRGGSYKLLPSSTYSRVLTNQPSQDLFITSTYIFCNCCSSVPTTYQCPTTLIVWYLFRKGLALVCFSWVKPKRSSRGTSCSWY